MDWPPAAEAFYLDTSSCRPVFQGDIFADVPFTKAKGGANADSEPTLEVERRHVATVLHPCDMYSGQGRNLNRVQSIAVVKEADLTIPEDWGGALSVCPLPDLLGDGEMWIADLARITNVDRSFLKVDRRVRCLSEIGWAIFRQRLAVAATRGMANLDDLVAVGAVTWRETEMAEQWCLQGKSITSFHDWLDQPDPNLSGFSRRKALERGMEESVKTSMEAALES